MSASMAERATVLATGAAPAGWAATISETARETERARELIGGGS
jgi:hypothetical protein